MAKILIIEDEAPALNTLKKFLEGKGHTVLSAFSAPEGLKTAIEQKPDVMVLDILMPSSNGLEILPELRTSDWGKNANVIVLTNLAGDEYRNEAQRMNVSAYLIKTDTSLEELSNTIDKIT